MTDLAIGLEHVELTRVDCIDDAWACLRWLGERRYAPVLGLDLETEGFSPYRDKIRYAQVGDENKGWAIPWERWGGVFEDVVSRWDGEFVLHNGPFDTRFLDRAGLVIPRARLHDTRPMWHILDPVRSTGLKQLAGAHIDRRAAVLQDELDAAIGKSGGWTWATVPMDYEPYWSYAALDPVLTVQLFHLAKPRLIDEGTWSTYTDIELAVQWVLQAMMERGAHVDLQHADAAADKYGTWCDQIEYWIRDQYGISAGSNQAVIDVLIREGFNFTKRTNGGALSLDKEVLASIDHPLASAVGQRRKVQRVVSTYLNAIRTLADTDDIIHATINPIGARTSRMSMQDPNLQNLPRTSENDRVAQTVRDCYTSRYGEDGILVFSDFDQIEMRGLAHLSGDPGLDAALRSGEDFFTVLARRVFQDDSITKKHPYRQLTKSVAYGKSYGAGVAKMAATAGVPESQMADAMYLFDSEFPGVRAFQRRVYDIASAREEETGEAWVRCPLTHRRHVADDGKAYTLVNYLIQGLAASLYKKKLVELDQAGLGEWMILPVHDEVILDVPNSERDNVLKVLREVMNDEEILDVPVTAGLAVGSRWGSKVDVD
jgi:DNA polymerase I